MKVRNRLALRQGQERRTLTLDKLVVNPFVSEAQRRACYAADDPAWDCSEWEAATPKGRKLPKRKVVTNRQRQKIIANRKKGKTVAKGKNPLKIDPTRTITLRRAFAAEVSKRFAYLKGQVVKLIGEEDALGLKEAKHTLNYDPDQPRDDHGRFGAAISGVKGAVGAVSAALDRVPVVGKIKAGMKKIMAGIHGKLEARYGSKTATAIMASGAVGGYAVAAAAAAVTGVPGIPFVNDLASIAAHTALAEIGLQVGRLLGKRLVGNEDLSWLQAEMEADFRKLLLEHEKEMRDQLTPLAVNTRWKFHTSSEQVKAFQEWLKTQIKAKIAGATEEALWLKYTQAGFAKGAGRAFDDVRTSKLMREKPELFTPQNQASLRDFYAGTKDEFLRSSFAQPVAVEKVKLLAGRSFDDLKNVTEDMSTRMSRVLTDGLVEGKGPREIARDLAAEVDLGRDRALLIARTEVIRAHSEGQLHALEQLGVEEVGVSVEFSTADDEMVCPRCSSLEGIVLKIEEAHGLIPVHPNCLPGDVLVSACHPIAAASKRFYNGDLIVIRTASGRMLSCTPNHPILTDHGFIAANLLDIGSNVVCDGRSQWEGVADNEDENVPTAIEQVAEALARSGEVATAEVPTTPPDFHGDGLGSKVAVIWSNRKLLNAGDTPFLKQRHQFDFVVGNIHCWISLAGLSGQALLPKALDAATRGLVRSADLLFAFVGCPMRPLQELRFALAPSSNSGVCQPPFDRPARYAEELGNCVLGHSRCVKIDNRIAVKQPKTTGSILTAQNAHDDLGSNAELVRQITSGSAGPVFLDQVVSLTVQKFNGHVYNLETLGGWYAANGIITHNCRCAFLPSGVGESSEGQKDTKPAIDSALADAGLDDRVGRDRPQSILGNRLVDWFSQALNAFCPTGPGGGVDPTCSPGGQGGSDLAMGPGTGTRFFKGKDSTKEERKEHQQLRDRRPDLRKKVKDGTAAPEEVQELAAVEKRIKEIEKAVNDRNIGKTIPQVAPKVTPVPTTPIPRPVVPPANEDAAYRASVRERALKAVGEIENDAAVATKEKDRLAEHADRAFQNYLAKSKEITDLQEKGKLTALEAQTMLNELEKPVLEAQKAYSEVVDRATNVAARSRAAFLQEVRPPETVDPANIRGMLFNPPSKNFSDTARKGEQFLHGVLSNAHGPHKVDYVVGTESRGFHQSLGNGKGNIILADGGSVYTVVHEWGHQLEHGDKEVLNAAQAFLNRRVGGERPVQLNTIFKDTGYEDYEMGRKDEFDKAFNARSAYYVGKDYGGRASEITSMGLQKLYEDPITFARKDPDYFDFIIGVAHRRLK